LISASLDTGAKDKVLSIGRSPGDGRSPTFPTTGEGAIGPVAPCASSGGLLSLMLEVLLESVGLVVMVRYDQVLLLLLLLMNRSNNGRGGSGRRSELLLGERMVELGLLLDELVEEGLGIDEDRRSRVGDRVVDGDILVLFHSRWLLVVNGLLGRANWWGGWWGDDAGILVLSIHIVHDEVLLGKLGSWSWNIADLGSTEGEAWALRDSALQLGNRDALAGIHLKDETKDRIQILGDWKDGAEEVGLLDEGTEGAVRRVSTLPWVATASQVDEDDTQ
jgi:hypothetical protein